MQYSSINFHKFFQQRSQDKYSYINYIRKIIVEADCNPPVTPPINPLFDHLHNLYGPGGQLKVPVLGGCPGGTMNRMIGHSTISSGNNSKPTQYMRKRLRHIGLTPKPRPQKGILGSWLLKVRKTGSSDRREREVQLPHSREERIFGL